MSEKKELRTSLSPKEFGLMLLMPVSNLASWALVVSTTVQHPGDVAALLSMYRYVAAFYVAWALRNKLLAGNAKEQGHLTYGTVLAGALAGRAVFAGSGCVAVALSIVLVLSTIGSWPIGKLAHVMKKTYLWALIFKSYLVSKLVLNLVVVGLLIRARLAS